MNKYELEQGGRNLAPEVSCYLGICAGSDVIHKSYTVIGKVEAVFANGKGQVEWPSRTNLSRFCPASDLAPGSR